MKSLRILPEDQLVDSIVKPKLTPFAFGQTNKSVYFTESGKHAIRIIAEFHGLSRDDETCIITSSNSSFVSSCVTSTLFNFCKVSRVLTDKTKLIFVIHEFGFPCEQVETWGEAANHRKIPMVEDIAHSLTSSFEGRPLGSFGDYAIHSLPKSLCLNKGGILLSSSKDVGAKLPMNRTLRNAFKKESQMLHWAHDRRRFMFECLSSVVSEPLIYNFTEGSNPFCLAYKVSSDIYSQAIQRAESYKIELLRTHNSGWITIPLNPWYSDSDVARLIEFTKQVSLM